jgi:hypothetical protein
MQCDDAKILDVFEPWIEKLTGGIEEFYREDVCQDLRLEILQQIRKCEKNQKQVNFDILCDKLKTCYSRVVKKYLNGGLRWVPTNPKTIELTSINGDVDLSNIFYSN